MPIGQSGCFPAPVGVPQERSPWLGGRVMSSGDESGETDAGFWSCKAPVVITCHIAGFGHRSILKDRSGKRGEIRAKEETEY